MNALSLITNVLLLSVQLSMGDNVRMYIVTQFDDLVHGIETRKSGYRTRTKCDELESCVNWNKESARWSFEHNPEKLTCCFLFELHKISTSSERMLIDAEGNVSRRIFDHHRPAYVIEAMDCALHSCCFAHSCMNPVKSRLRLVNEGAISSK